MSKASKILEKFFQSTLVEKAGSVLGDGAEIRFHVGDETFYFRRAKNQSQWTKGQGENPDFEFWVTEYALRQLVKELEDPNSGYAKLGIEILERIVRGEPRDRIRFKVHAGVLSIWSKGYFSVLKLGGPEVASYLAQLGFTSFQTIKEVLKNSRR